MPTDEVKPEDPRKAKKMSNSVAKPIIKQIKDSRDALDFFETVSLPAEDEKTQEIIMNFPTVYIHNWQDSGDFEVYVGESNDIFKRTRQHYDAAIDKSKWQSNLVEKDARLFIIGHEHFNKSLTLDIENRLIHYMMSAERVKHVHNLRDNPQTSYYPMEELDEIFSKIWRGLRKENKELFPTESAIKDSAIYKASPLHKLTKEQEKARELIIQKVSKALENGETKQMIFIDGEAGTGKTVLNSSTFYELYCQAEENNTELKCHLLVNHDEQITVYEQIAEKLGLTGKYGKVVSKPTTFIIDDNICEHTEEEPVFSYMLITDKQNNYMHMFQRLFRFLGYFKEEVDHYLYKKEMTMPVDYVVTIGDRGEQADVSPLELHFEQSFSNAYGINALKYLSREYGICDEEGKNYFLGYLVRTKDKKIAVEENGVTYHHPQIIGALRYKNQLRKQNTCALWGIKLFRFSTEDCVFDNRIEDDIKQFFGRDTSDFVDNGFKIDRPVELYEHQTVSLQEIQKRREAGIKAFLIVLPTAAGKSKTVEEDLREFAKNRQGFRGLILAPGINILADWEERIKTSLPELVDNIDIRTYAYMARHYTDVQSDYYQYVVIDEAHHAVAPVLKRVIQYFDSVFTVGLTATDQRPDKKKLETVFGTYTTSLSLKEAMEKEVVAKANVYRIETNIDLSQVRFNGKDYINADLEKRIRVTSRNELIVSVLEEYFTSGEAGIRQGVIFCVNVSHANEMAKLLNKAGLTAASYTGQTKNPAAVMDEFKKKRIRFLCACNMISEGWDYPELGILVMARPTLSKVLYLQQIGRGLRKTDVKNNVIVIDVVDEYGAMVKACNMHSFFKIHIMCRLVILHEWITHLVNWWLLMVLKRELKELLK